MADLGFLFTQQTGTGPVAPVNNGGDVWSGVAEAIQSASENAQARAVSRAQAEEARQRALATQRQREARQTLGELISRAFAAPSPPDYYLDVPAMRPADPGAIPPNMPALADPAQPSITYEMRRGPNDMETWGTPLLSDAERAAQARIRAAEVLTDPATIAKISGLGVEAGEPGTGANIADILANISVAARDADSVAGYRGTQVQPGSHVFQSGADQNFQTQEANDILQNREDNEASTRNQRIQSGATIASARIAADQRRESDAADRTARRTEAQEEQSRATAARWEQQTLARAFNQYVRQQEGEEIYMPPGMAGNVQARAAEMLREDPSLSTAEAIAAAMREMVVENEGGRPGSWFFNMGAGDEDRNYEYTERGRNYRPRAEAAPSSRQAPPPQPPSGVPATRPVPRGTNPRAGFIEGGALYDGQGRFVRMVTEQ